MTKFDEPIGQCKCTKFRCSEKISPEVQFEIREFYWNIESYEEKNAHIAKLVTKEPTKRMTVNKDYSKKTRNRENNVLYLLPKDDTHIKVCKEMFEKTMGITQKKVKVVLEKKDAMNWSHGAKNKSASNATSGEVIKEIEKHIEKFPTIRSHYRRQYSNKRYFEQDLTVAKMFKAFEKENPGTKIKLSTYKKVYNRYNIGWFKSLNQRMTSVPHAQLMKIVRNRHRR